MLVFLNRNPAKNTWELSDKELVTQSNVVASVIAEYLYRHSAIYTDNTIIQQYRKVSTNFITPPVMIATIQWMTTGSDNLKWIVEYAEAIEYEHVEIRSKDNFEGTYGGLVALLRTYISGEADSEKATPPTREMFGDWSEGGKSAKQISQRYLLHKHGDDEYKRNFDVRPAPEWCLKPMTRKFVPKKVKDSVTYNATEQKIQNLKYYKYRYRCQYTHSKVT